MLLFLFSFSQSQIKIFKSHKVIFDLSATKHCVYSGHCSVCIIRLLKMKSQRTHWRINLMRHSVCHTEPSEKGTLKKILGRWLDEPSVYHHLTLQGNRIREVMQESSLDADWSQAHILKPDKIDSCVIPWCDLANPAVWQGNLTSLHLAGHRWAT